LRYTIDEFDKHSERPTSVSPWPLSRGGGRFDQCFFVAAEEEGVAGGGGGGRGVEGGGGLQGFLGKGGGV